MSTRAILDLIEQSHQRSHAAAQMSESHREALEELTRLRREARHISERVTREADRGDLKLDEVYGRARDARQERSSKKKSKMIIELWHEVLEAISSGHPNSDELAAAALVELVEVSQWGNQWEFRRYH